MSRKRAREYAFLTIFAAGFRPDDPLETAMDQCLEAHDETDLGGERQYFEDIVRGVFENREKYLTALNELSEKWSVVRISKVAQAILMLAFYELDERSDVPPKVAINEALELAKKYETNDAASFINGILGVYFKKEDS